MNSTSLGLAWFGGPTAAAALLQADPNASAMDVLTQSLGAAKAQQFASANPEILNGKTAGQVVAMNQKSMGGAAGGAGGVPVSQSPLGAPGSPAMPPTAGSGPYQPTPLPPMPSTFAQPTGGPIQATQVQMPGGHQGDGLIATGLAMMGGNGWHDSMAKAGDVVAQQQALAQKNALANAQLQDTATARDIAAPELAAQVAANRANAWSTLNSPGRITAFQAGQLNNQSRAQDVAMYDAQQKAAYNAIINSKSTPMIIPSDGTKPDQYLTQETGKNGAISYVLPDGTKTSQMPDGAVPATSFQHPDPLTAATMKANVKTETTMAQDASTARDQDQRFANMATQLQKPGQNVGPGFLAAAGRALDNAMGTNLTGNLSDQQVTNSLLNQDMLGQFAKNAKAGGGRASDALRTFVMNAQPHLGQDPQAILQVTQVLRDANALPMKIQQLYAGQDVDGIDGLTPTARLQLRRTGSVAGWADGMKQKLIAGSITRAQQAMASPAQPAAAGAPSANRPPIASFFTDPASTAPAAPTATPVPADAPANLPMMGR